MKDKEIIVAENYLKQADPMTRGHVVVRSLLEYLDQQATDYGLMEISRDQARDLLTSCETALGERDKSINDAWGTAGAIQNIVDQQAEYIKALEAVYTAVITTGEYCELCAMICHPDGTMKHDLECPCLDVEKLREQQK